MDVLTLSSSESQTVSARNKYWTRYGSADAKKSRIINKQVSSPITTWWCFHSVLQCVFVSLRYIKMQWCRWFFCDFYSDHLCTT